MAPALLATLEKSHLRLLMAGCRRPPLRLNHRCAPVAAFQVSLVGPVPEAATRYLSTRTFAVGLAVLCDFFRRWS